MLVRRSFLLFIATIPFETIVLPVLPGFLSPAKISGLLFFGCCLLYPKTCFSRPTPPVLWFSGYLTIFLVFGALIPAELRGSLRTPFLTLVQLVALFWLSSSLLQNSMLARRSLLTFGAAASGLALATLLRLPGFDVTTRAGGGLGGEALRATPLGYDPNSLAGVLGVGAVMLIGLLLDNTKRTRRRAWFLAGLTLPLLVLLVSTSSRGGLVAFILGASLFLIPLAPSRRRIASFLLGVFALIAVGAMAARDPVSAARWNQTYQGGNVAGRDNIFAQARRMFLERPILGWGPVEFLYELGSRTNRITKDPHSMYVWLVLEVGLVGALCFLTGVWLCLRAAWKARTGPEGILALALMIEVLVINLSITWLARKTMWFVFALALAAPAVLPLWRRKQVSRSTLPARP